MFVKSVFGLCDFIIIFIINTVVTHKYGEFAQYIDLSYKMAIRGTLSKPKLTYSLNCLKGNLFC